MKKPHIVSFIACISFTILAFWSVVSDQIPEAFAVAFIFGLAIIQIIFQAAYWMHLNQKGHEYPLIFLVQGAAAIFVTILASTTLIWW